MSFPNVALIDRTRRRVVKHDDLLRYRNALQQQVHEHLASIWEVWADISAPAAGEDIPEDAWLLMIVDSLPGKGGVHLDKHGHPYAEAVNGDKLSIALSHELLEMLVDPQGNSFKRAIDCDRPNTGRNQWLA